MKLTLEATPPFATSVPPLLAVAILSFLTACSREPTNRLQGYIEGEFLYIASPLSGKLERLRVREGSQLKAGDLLFELESVVERAALEEAQRRLAEAKARLEDARKGSRPSEIDALEAQVGQARAAFELSEKELARQETLIKSQGATTEQQLERAHATRDESQQRLAQLQAELKTAMLGARPDQIEAAEANVRALAAQVTRAEWDLAQKSQSAPEAAVVFDTLYNEGEWVAAGRPVVSLLPPDEVKLRVFVPQKWLSSLQLGDELQVFVDGADQAAIGTVSFISPKAEFTPPVVYTADNRNKFVYLIEATFEPAVAAGLHPGQPVDVVFPSIPSDD